MAITYNPNAPSQNFSLNRSIDLYLAGIPLRVSAVETNTAVEIAKAFFAGYEIDRVELVSSQPWSLTCGLIAFGAPRSREAHSGAHAYFHDAVLGYGSGGLWLSRNVLDFIGVPPGIFAEIQASADQAVTEGICPHKVVISRENRIDWAWWQVD